jgi:hypothetical protein
MLTASPASAQPTSLAAKSRCKTMLLPNGGARWTSAFFALDLAR